MAFARDGCRAGEPRERGFAELQQRGLVPLDLEDVVAAEAVDLGGGGGGAVARVAGHGAAVELPELAGRGPRDQRLLPFFLMGVELAVRP